MSTRAHVITKYEINYGSEGLTWGQSFMESLAYEYMTDYYIGGETHSDAAIWEFNKDEFKAMTETLSKMTSDEYISKCNECGIDPDDYQKDDVVDLFRSWLKETPENEDYVRISWF